MEGGGGNEYRTKDTKQNSSCPFGTVYCDFSRYSDKRSCLYLNRVPFSLNFINWSVHNVLD